MDAFNSALGTRDWILGNSTRSYASTSAETMTRTRIRLGKGRSLSRMHGNFNPRAEQSNCHSRYSDMDLRPLKGCRWNRILRRRIFNGGHVATRASSEEGANKVVNEKLEKEAKQLTNGAFKFTDPVDGRRGEPELNRRVTVTINGGKHGHGELWQWLSWKRIPQRYKLIGTTSLAFVICNMDKVNLSVAIIPMSHQLRWNASTAGLVQSSFFWGYALSQLPGGWLAKRIGGSIVLKFGVLLWSLATALVPIVSGFMPGLVFVRSLVGIGEGVSPSAATDLIAKTIPITERSRAVAFVFSGLSVGTVLGLLFAPPCIENFGWESVFYIFGLLGLLWCVGFQLAIGGVESTVVGQAASLGDKSPVISENSTRVSGSASNTPLDIHATDFNTLQGAIPWKAFLKSRVVWAMVYVHFCGNWGHYTCLSWLPTYFSEELQLDLTNAALVSILPSLASILVSNMAAQLADNLISSGIETTTVRKLCQSIAFIAPAICMTISSLDVGLSPWETVAVLTVGLALSSFALAGLYCTHQDISPEYASVLLGLTSTAGAFPGIIGVALTGYLLDQTHSWAMALFAPSIFFYLTGTIVWLAFASSKPQRFVR